MFYNSSQKIIQTSLSLSESRSGGVGSGPPNFRRLYPQYQHFSEYAVFLPSPLLVVKPLHKSCFRFKSKFSLWLVMTLGLGCFAHKRQRMDGAGCWLRGLECAIGAWLASSFGLRTCQVGRLGVAVAIFQNGKNLSKERLFLHFNYQDRLARDRKRGCAQRRTTGVFASTSYRK